VLVDLLVLLVGCGVKPPSFHKKILITSDKAQPRGERGEMLQVKKRGYG
jgi:hypothetical protein